MRILVRAPNWIGDQVLAFPFFHYLRQAYPNAYIAAACVPWVESLQFRNLVNEVIVLPMPQENTWLAKLKVLRDAGSLLRSRGPWDIAYSLPNSFSSAWLLYRSGAHVRRGYRQDGRGLLLNEGLSWHRAASEHRAEAYVGLIPPAMRPAASNGRSVKEFWGVPPENDLDPGIPAVVPNFDAEAAWPDVQPLEPPKGDYWVLAPGSVAESRRWPVESFAALARMIVERTGMPGVIVGGKSEIRIADALSRDRDLRLSDWTYRGSAAGLHRVFRNARFTVSNDSGLAHVAALCGSTVFVAWGAGDPKRTAPLGPGRVRLNFNPVDCWPCESNSCLQPLGQKLRCLQGIQPAAIWEEIERVIGR
jgi:heptosyltransferase-2